MASNSKLPNKLYWEERLKERFREVDNVEIVLKKQYLNVYHTLLKDYTTLLKDYEKHGGGYDFKKLEQDMFYNSGFNFKVSRYQSMIDRLDIVVDKLGNNEEILFEQLLVNQYKQNYYELIYEMEKGYGYNLSFAFLTDKRLKQVVHTAWASDGIEFSDRVWKNKKLLTQNLRSILEESIASGENPRKTATRLKEVTGNSFYNAQRVIRTETTAIVAESDSESYKEMGFEKYVINATFDSRTSEICGEFDGKEFLLNEVRIGVNAPPFHP